VHLYYTAVHRKKEAVSPDAAETFLAVSRRRYVIRRYELTRAQYVLLDALVRGQSVGEAINVAADAAGGDEEDFAADLTQWFRDWTAEGLFRAVELVE
jgi:hypothetical protein